MVGRHVQGVDSLGLHVPHEVHEVAAVGFDRVVRQQRVADPGDQRPGGGRSVAVRLQGAGEKGLDLGRGRSVAFEEIAALRHQGRAGRGSRRQGGEVGAVIFRDNLHGFFRDMLHSVYPARENLAMTSPDSQAEASNPWATLKADKR
jgi:hypothetical protein